MYKLFCNSIVTCCLLLAICSCFSCLTVKDLTYFRDIADSSKSVKYKLADYDVPKIRQGDFISVNIYTTDASASSTVNLPNIPAGATQVGISNDQNGYKVDKDGNIELPQIGKVKVVGLTIEQARELIRANAETYFKNPVVIVKGKGIKVTLLGEVIKPGIYYVSTDKPNIIDAIGLTNDLTSYAKKDNVILLRTEGGVLQSIKLNLEQSSILKSPYYYLKDEDVLIFEPTNAKAISSDVVFSRNLSLLGVVLSTLTTLVLLFRK